MAICVPQNIDNQQFLRIFYSLINDGWPFDRNTVWGSLFLSDHKYNLCKYMKLSYRYICKNPHFQILNSWASHCVFRSQSKFMFEKSQTPNRLATSWAFTSTSNLCWTSFVIKSPYNNFCVYVLGGLTYIYLLSKKTSVFFAKSFMCNIYAVHDGMLQALYWYVLIKSVPMGISYARVSPRILICV